MLIAVALTLVEKDPLPEPLLRLLTASMYSVGFIFVILGRSELFTEHTTLAVLPVLGGHSSLSALLRLWVLVYISNQAGAAVFAGLIFVVGPALGTIRPEVLEQIATEVVRHSWWVMALSAVLAGWLMGLLSWLVAAGRDTISQIVIIWLIASSIGLAGLHHSIAGAVEVLVGLFTTKSGLSPGFRSIPALDDPGKRHRRRCLCGRPQVRAGQSARSSAICPLGAVNFS